MFLRRLVDSLYVRNDLELNRGNFRIKGDTVDIYLAYSDNLLRVMFWMMRLTVLKKWTLFPAYVSLLLMNTRFIPPISL